MYTNRSLFSTLAFLASFSILLTFLPFILQAQEAAAPVATAGVVIANINLSNATILNQTEESLTIEFELENQGSTPQFDIRYGVELIQNNEGGSQTIADSFVGRETLTLSAGQRVGKVVEYPLSGISAGTYSVWVSAKTTGGTMLGLGNAGTITLAAKNVLEIKANSCKLTIGAEAKSYSLNQGVDIASTEDLNLTCVVKNHGSVARSVVPQYETYKRTTFGDKVMMTYPAEVAITLEADEEKAITLLVPKATDPQAYDVALNFIDESSRAVVSNRLVTHYVIQGVSATIQTVSLDKSYYATGDPISINLLWSPSADGFLESRLGAGTSLGGAVTALVEVVDINKVACSEKVLQELDKQIVTINTTAVANCVKPTATVSLIGPDGKSLDTRSIEVTESEIPPLPAATEVVAPSENNKILMTVTIIAFAVSFLTILFVLSRRKKEGTLV